MATVYSLLVPGGRAGASVTIGNNGSGKVRVTWTKHGLPNAFPVYFTYSSAPANIDDTTKYYAKQIAADTFDLYTDSALTAAVSYSSTGTAVLCLSAFWHDFDTDAQYGDYYGVDKTRYGTAGSERVYGSWATWISTRRSSCLAADIEKCEVGPSWNDITASALIDDMTCYGTETCPEINGIKTPAWNGQNYGTGYKLSSSTNSAQPLQLGTNPAGVQTGTFKIFRDLGVEYTGSGADTYAAVLYGYFPQFKRNFVYGPGTSGSKNCGGIRIMCIGGTIAQNTVARFKGGNASFCIGIQWWQYSSACTVVNNAVVDCTVGYERNGANTFSGWFYNNEAFGNTTNWGTKPTGPLCLNSAGESGNTPWDSGSTAITTLVSGDFTTYDSAGNSYDLRPAATSSHQVDAGLLVPGMEATDALGNEIPAYNNGGAEIWDIGPIEKNLGYTRPEQHDLVLTVEAGYDIKVFTAGSGAGATPLDSDSGSGTTYTYPAGVAGVSVDFTVQMLGKKPVRFTNVALDATETAYEITLETDLNYVTSSGLTWGSNFTYDPATKYLKSSAATSGRNLYSALIEAFIAQSTLNNVSFDFEMNGPGGLVLKNGVETRGYSTAGSGYDWNTSTSTLYKITDDGVQYKNTSGTVAATFASITTTGIPAGVQGRFQQADGSGTTNFRSTGDVNQLVQVYGDGTHGSVSALTHFVSKVQAPGYDEAAMDAVATYGNLEGQGYVVPLVPAANGIADASGITGLTYTDHGASPVTWHSKVFSITITDTTDTHTGEQIIQWIRHNNTFNYHDLVQKNGSSYKTVRGAIYGDTGATLKGVRVVRSDGSTGHYDFDLFTADDGTTYSPPVIAALTASAAANTRFVLYNVTQDAEIDNVFAAGGGYAYTITTEADVDDTLDLHYFTVGKQEGRTRFTWGGVSTTVAVEQTADAVETALATELGITGADVTEFAMDVTGAIEVDADDADGSTQKARLALWYKYILTTEDGARYFRGGISLLSTAAIRINVSVVDIKIENVSATKGLFFTDTERRLYRSDGTSIVVAASQPGSIENDYSGVPDTVETGVSGLTGAESAAVIAGAASAAAAEAAASAAASAAGALPDAPTIATAVWSKTLP